MTLPTDLKDKTCLVTGASSGIGAAVARARTLRRSCRGPLSDWPRPSGGSCPLYRGAGGRIARFPPPITSVYPLNQGSPLCQARPWRNPAWFTAGGVSFVRTYARR